MAIIHLPTPFIKVTEVATLTLAANNVRTLIDMLIKQYPALNDYLLTSDKQLTSFMNIYVNQQDIRYLAKENTTLNNDDIVAFVPAMAGG